MRFEPDEVILLINAAAESTRTRETFAPPASLGLIRDGGVVRIETTGAGISDTGVLRFLERSRPVIRVPATGTKNKQAAAQPISDRMVPPLKDFLADCEAGPPIFPGLTRKEPPKTSKMIANDMEEACIPKVVDAGKRDFHSLRSSYGSILADAGLDIPEVRVLMRHACITTTAGYVPPPSDLARRAAAILPVPPIWDQG